MPATSKKQYRFMQAVKAFKDGKLDDPSDEIKKVANDISNADLDDMLDCEYDSLPERDEHTKLSKIMREKLYKNSSALSERYAVVSKIFELINNHKDIGDTVQEVASAISEVIAESDEDWFDKHTTKRNMSQLIKRGGEFKKTYKEFLAVSERLQALYEEVGFIINRYV